MATATLTIYTGRECCLCDDLRAALEPLLAELELEAEWVEIDGDHQLEQRWRESIPVAVLDGRPVFKYHLDAAQLRRRIAERRDD